MNWIKNTLLGVGLAAGVASNGVAQGSKNVSHELGTTLETTHEETKNTNHSSRGGHRKSQKHGMNDSKVKPHHGIHGGSTVEYKITKDGAIPFMGYEAGGKNLEGGIGVGLTSKGLLDIVACAKEKVAHIDVGVYPFDFKLIQSYLPLSNHAGFGIEIDGKLYRNVSYYLGGERTMNLKKEHHGVHDSHGRFGRAGFVGVKMPITRSQKKH